MQNMQCSPEKYAVLTAKHAVPHAKHAVPMQNMQYKTKLSPSYPQSYPQKGVTPLQNMQCHMQNTQYPMQNTQYPLQNMQ